MSRSRVLLILLVSLLLFRLLRGSLLLMGAALVGTLLALFGTRVVRRKRPPAAPVSPGAPTAAPGKPYDPSLVLDAKYEEIE